MRLSVLEAPLRPFNDSNENDIYNNKLLLYQYNYAILFLL
jgi:hypothetical protein